jgi:hypothetical protein
MDVVELTPHMSPACSFYDPAAFVEMMEPSIAIGLQDTGEVAQMLLRMYGIYSRNDTLSNLRVSDPPGFAWAT